MSQHHGHIQQLDKIALNPARWWKQRCLMKWHDSERGHFCPCQREEIIATTSRSSL